MKTILSLCLFLSLASPVTSQDRLTKELLSFVNDPGLIDQKFQPDYIRNVYASGEYFDFLPLEELRNKNFDLTQWWKD